MNPSASRLLHVRSPRSRVRTGPASPLPLVLLALPLALSCAPPASAQAPELVFLSNITGTTDGDRALTTIEEQTTATLDALGAELSGHGLGYEDVVAVNVFLRDTRHFQGMNGVYRTYFAENAPTRATVRADLPDVGALIQISAVATPDDTEVFSPSGLQSPALPYSW